MIIKVCGIKTEGNIQFLSELKIDMVGLNFYKPSVRYVSEDINPQVFDAFSKEVKRVGVFVNENVDQIFHLAEQYKLDFAQLHGDESIEDCRTIAKILPIIKVFRIDDSFDFSQIQDFDFASYFLFDTQTKNYGGSGKKFDWQKLNQYSGSIPFLLSGGIGPRDAETLLLLDHPQFVGIDINSKFESQPGIKDKALILPFIQSLRMGKKS